MTQKIESLTIKWKVLVTKLPSYVDRTKRARGVVEEIQQEIKEKQSTSTNDKKSEDCSFLRFDLDITSDK